VAAAQPRPAREQGSYQRGTAESVEHLFQAGVEAVEHVGWNTLTILALAGPPPARTPARQIGDHRDLAGHLA
jgi:hypothetical protein